MSAPTPVVRLWAWRAGFLVSIALVAAAAGIILWTALRSGGETQRRVRGALERARVISRSRLDAVALEAAIEAHVRASTDAQRGEAAALINGILTDLRQSRAAYRDSLDGRAPAETEAWEQFEQTSRELAERVRAAATEAEDSHPPERVRRETIEKIQPLFVALDGLASRLEAANSREASELEAHLEEDRRRQLRWSGAVLAAAVLLALLVGSAMAARMKQQAVTIRRQLAELDARNQELDAFAGRVAHDLIGPMAPLEGHITIARRSAAVRADPGAANHLDQARASVARMAGLVDALLRFCRAGTRGAPAAGSLDAVVNAQLMDVVQTAAAARVGVEREISRGVEVDCPPQLLHCIAQNLLSNAVKYSAGSAEARVKVRVAVEGERGVLAVEDNGPGMTAAVVGQLYRPFFRGPDAQDRPGHGLGLATTKRLVEAHGGALELESRPGQGTRVVARLPLWRARPLVPGERATPPIAPIATGAPLAAGHLPGGRER